MTRIDRASGSYRRASEHRAVAAWVGDQPVLTATVDRKLDAVHHGRWAAILPNPTTAEGRQLRRWITQVVVTEVLLDHLATNLALNDNHSEELPSATTLALQGAAALELGSIVAAALASSPVARRVYEHVAGGTAVDAEEVRRYYDRNEDLFAAPGGPAPFAAVRQQLTAELTQVTQRRHFLQWLDHQRAQLVRLEPGYEHPADPRNPDSTHRH